MTVAVRVVLCLVVAVIVAVGLALLITESFELARPADELRAQHEETIRRLETELLAVQQRSAAAVAEQQTLTRLALEKQNGPLTVVDLIEQRTAAGQVFQWKEELRSVQRRLSSTPESFGLGVTEKDFAWAITTSLQPPYFERALAVHRTWGSVFSKLVYIVNESDEGKRMLLDRKCEGEMRMYGDEAVTEFVCDGSMRIVMIKDCADEHALNCKFEKALLHLTQRGWDRTTRWLAQTDDDVYVWPANFFLFMSRVLVNPLARDVVLAYRTPLVWEICSDFPPKVHTQPIIPVTSAAVILSQTLFARVLPFMRNGTLSAFQRMGWPMPNIDVMFGLLLHNLRPWSFIVLPMCDDVVSCSDDFVIVHGARPPARAHESAEAYNCRASGPHANTNRQSFDFWHKRVAQFVAGTEFRPETVQLNAVRPLWNITECDDYQKHVSPLKPNKNKVV
jgi:hypothetical protein